MTTPKVMMETKASHSGKVVIPDDFAEAYLVTRLGWTVAELRQTPQHIIDKILFIWHVEGIAEEAAARPKPSSGKRVNNGK
jgi:hypothetical protein